MNKSTLEKFIKKYSLDGSVSAVRWKCANETLSTRFVTEDKSLLGELKLNNFKIGALDNTEMGIGETETMSKLLGIVGTDVDINSKKAGDRSMSVSFSDDLLSSEYFLSDLSVLPEAPALKHKPDFGTEIKLDDKLMGAFIRGKSALPDAETFTLMKNGAIDTLKLIIGYSTINTNRVTIPVKTQKMDDFEMVSFNAKHFKSVLSANKECKEALLQVSTEGLAKISFAHDNFEVTYYLVAVNN
tara:strand:- start:325 stop:1053 length:729 start_codon:yes stop_codon:yes gene_type:complete